MDKNEGGTLIVLDHESCSSREPLDLAVLYWVNISLRF